MTKPTKEQIEMIAKVIDNAVMAEIVDGRFSSILYAQQIASQDEVKPDDYLLTDEELKIIAVQYANQICTSNPIKLWNDVEFVRINIKAQLAKVRPYILTGEQQAIWEEAIRAEVYKEINSGQPVDSKER